MGEVAAGVEDVDTRALTSTVEVLEDEVEVMGCPAIEREPDIFTREASRTPRGTFLCGQEVEGALLSFGGGFLLPNAGVGCMNI
jgi:hypothetical protein